ncbi:MAG: 16S rRNA (cytosine(1402)-N(4))-methyltransferase RsmH [Candidatus Omnitrophica bacterium]|nr:16S rRNA (cytosine(1402)-N(4))-methyltransferase RsmH [Candidatus Omnitrophota bacterium]MBU1048062.1 16S rRNA (cytosine(1402)-N(4))-methyltransferase RsmH [Candidatus Omnitrophota bacterium]MBU1767652.1 16S rRNA (cytosine(1402)-N(4))-methyltransferase RsmH [Candidatus Omnitrophota bacterium]MBU1889432.1 16S rRNA (cytosine(1402)-N(4))-methyltransferase RsmH [Candidatus Omnitrophota bacterium]
MDELLFKTEKQEPGAKEVVHIPVLLKEILQYLQLKEGGIYVDCTIGEGGHSQKILKNIGEKGFLVGLDKDAKLLDIAKKRLAKISKNFALINDDFLNLPSHLKMLKLNKVDGILFDFGISSFQLENFSRGFSFKNNGPLDMRFDSSSLLICEELINQANYEELYQILKDFGEERRASLIARRIIQKRKEKRIKTTFELAEIASKALGKGKGKIDPATRTFQAFRIAVNKELESIEKILPQIPDLLADGGIACAISYHSLEDRLVKRAFKAAKEMGTMKIITKKPIRPLYEEIIKNSRSRSAKLRVAEKIKFVRKSVKEMEFMPYELSN